MKRQSITGWAVVRDKRIIEPDDGEGTCVYIYPSRAHALDCATLGKHDVQWQRDILKDGYRAVKLRLTATVLQEKRKGA